jgi:hypothetical protein
VVGQLVADLEVGVLVAVAEGNLKALSTPLTSDNTHETNSAHNRGLGLRRMIRTP